MLNSNRRVVVAGGVRIPFVRSFREYAQATNQEMLTTCIEGLVTKFRLNGKILGDVSLGAVMKSSVEWNLAREVILGTSLNPSTPAFNIQRACGTSMEAIDIIASKIATGQIDSGIGAGSDSNSDLPVMVKRSLAWKLININKARSFGKRLSAILKIRPRDLSPEFPGITEPRTGLSMGQHAEEMVKAWGITREEQDMLAFESHQKAAKAYEDGFYSDLIIPFKNATADTIVRGDTSLAKLWGLRTVFDRSPAGTLTAGNSTALTDGAAAVFLCSEEYATENDIPVECYLQDAAVAAVDFVNGAGLLMAPTHAVAKLLRRNNLTLQDFDFYEIHEAFAGQVLCTLRAWESNDYCRNELGLEGPLGTIDRNRLNVMGGSVAVGHPFGATGARIVGTLSKLLRKKGSGRGLISICTAGGMGVAAILERR
jgi:acetyl-CoA C-acetyltransferase